MKIHKEGHHLLIALVLVFTLIGWLAANHIPAPYFWLIETTLVVLFLLVLQFFRSPVFPIALNDRNILAPADGKVVVIEETHEGEYLNDKRIQVSIFMSPFNVHVNRMPIAAEVEMFTYHPGKYLVAWHPKSSTENERTTMALRTERGAKLIVRQIAGAVARRIKWYVKDGDKLNQGDEFGFIKFGSRVDLFLPLDSKIMVSEGQKTKGGRTVIAQLPA